MIGKKFTDLTNGRIVEVKDSFEDIAVLMDNSKIRVSRLMDRNFFDEYIDPKTFFHNENLLNSFAQKIRQIPDNILETIKENSASISNADYLDSSTSDPFRPASEESAVLPYDPEIEKEQIMKKYGIRKDPLEEARHQMEKINSLLNDMGDEGSEEPIRIEVMRDEVETITIQKKPIEHSQFSDSQTRIDNQPPTGIPPIDPVYQMFRGMKRSADFHFSIPILERIPRFDTIEMLEESFDFSVIDFLATEFTNNLIENPDRIKTMIASEIRRLMSEGDKLNQSKSKRKSSPKKTEQND